MQTRTDASLLLFTLIGAWVLARPALAEPPEQQIELPQQLTQQRIESPHTRYTFFAKAAFHRSAPLQCDASFTVTEDGHIADLKMETKSANVLYNVLVFQAIKSLDGDQKVLQFPPGSQRLLVRQKVTTKQRTQYGMDYQGSWTHSEVELFDPDDDAVPEPK